MTRLTLSRARRLALGAQGLAAVRHPSRVSMRELKRVIAQTKLFQIDSVNILMRAHYLPLFSRLGPYPPELLERAAREGVLVESWAHEASYVTPQTYQLLQWRQRRVHQDAWSSIRQAGKTHAEEIAAVQETMLALTTAHPRHPGWSAREVHEQLLATGFEPAGRDEPDWGWNWNGTKLALEYLFYRGEIVSAGRNRSFERHYHLPEHRLPAWVREHVSDHDAVRQLLELAIQAHGVGTQASFLDYFRLRGNQARHIFAELVGEGFLEPVEIAGWNAETFRHAEAKIPRTTNALTLLSPFDPLIFERSRLQALFGMHYRLEIYTPAAKREYGYYCLPCLFGEHIVGRVDLKANRASGTLDVLALHLQHDELAARRPNLTDFPSRAEAAAAVEQACADMGAWLRLPQLNLPTP